MLPLVLRTHLAVHGADSQIVATDDCWTVRTPSQPTFYWGNFLHFPRAPAPADVPHWLARFRRRIADLQPRSRHLAISWEGTAYGDAARLAGPEGELLGSVVMCATRLRPADGLPAAAELRAFDRNADWGAQLDLMLAGREPGHDERAYREFALRRLDGWRRGAQAGRGGWFGAFVRGALVASLGIYAEPAPGADGLRLARYQDVFTAAAWRRQGLSSALILRAGEAMRAAGADRFVILADDSGDTDRRDDREGPGSARRLYAARGFEVVGHLRAIERIAYPGAPTG